MKTIDKQIGICKCISEAVKLKVSPIIIQMYAKESERMNRLLTNSFEKTEERGQKIK